MINKLSTMNTSCNIYSCDTNVSGNNTPDTPIYYWYLSPDRCLRATIRYFFTKFL